MDVLSSRLLVRTDDLAASTAWWRDTLGLSVAREYGAEGVATGVAFFCGGVLVEFSGHGSDQDFETCLDLGAAQYHKKPLDIDLLLDSIRVVTQGAATGR